jgi:GNAT superfamily N-acetyltransferase
MSLVWTRENPPHWDETKATVVGGADEGIFPPFPYKPGDPLPGEWWRVEEEGKILGYGWMEATWGDAEMLLVIDPAARGRGVGAWVLDRLEEEAASRGLNYLHNVVQKTHPRREEVTRWFESNRFEKSPDDERLMRRIRSARKP